MSENNSAFTGFALCLATVIGLWPVWLFSFMIYSCHERCMKFSNTNAEYERCMK